MNSAVNKILVVDDEAQITRVLRHALESEGFQVRMAADGGSAIEQYRAWLPDLVITDLSMPGLDGLQVCSRLRQLSEVPILFLSVKGDEATKVKAFDLGADDYVSKPFGIAELMARVRALLRRKASATVIESRVEAGDFVIDSMARLVEVRGHSVHLTPKEFDLVLYLIANRGKVLTHRAILTQVWGSNNAQQNEYLRVFIGNLRKKLEKDPRKPCYIRTEPWIGYRFDVE